MGKLKTDFKFKLVKNFLSSDEISLGTYYLKLRHKWNVDKFDVHHNNCDSMFYTDPFCETILIKKLKKMEDETGLSLIPTYSFSRVYSYNADLKKHKDRPSCEVSATVMWGSDGTPWPIFMDGQKCEMEPGDAVIYLGCELEHYRENFEGDWHAQTFIHYIDKDGPYKDFAYDKRDFVHCPEINSNDFIKNVKNT